MAVNKYIYGDANYDGKVSVNDAIYVLRYLAKWDLSPTEANLFGMDANCDGKININDAILLLRYLAKWDVKLGPQ